MRWRRFELPNYYRTCVYFSAYKVAMQKNKLSMGYYIKKKSVLARSFRHEGEGHMNWRTRCTKYSPTCPLVYLPVGGRIERF